MLRSFLVAALSLWLGGCGFHLRGQEAIRLPYRSIYVQGNPNTVVVAELRRAIEVTGTTELAPSPARAQVVLAILGEREWEEILALSGGGRVSEYRLHYQVSFQLADRQHRLVIPPSTVALSQDISYNDSQVLAKQSEEAGLYKAMQRDAARQILRRVRWLRNGRGG
ncbi:MAG: LPS assembly lipoprotein LptE [Betaproteobacteria bacterium]|nr:LPS assembly lipoprotein LptE [Betaproteobacteria bacterium]